MSTDKIGKIILMVLIGIPVCYYASKGLYDLGIKVGEILHKLIETGVIF